MNNLNHRPTCFTMTPGEEGGVTGEEGGVTGKEGGVTGEEGGVTGEEQRHSEIEEELVLLTHCHSIYSNKAFPLQIQF